MADLHKQASEHRIAALGLVEPPPIQVELPAFSGSLGLMFECVRSGKLNLMGVPLAPICSAYLMYLIEHEMVSVDAAAAALNGLSYLVERKSWLLLPSSEPEPEEVEALALPDPTAHEYREVIDILRSLRIEREQTFFRSSEGGPDPYAIPFDVEDISPGDLARSLERLLRHAVPDPPEVLQKERKSLAEQMHVVLAKLTRAFQSLDEVFETPFHRTEAVFTFLALLELIRLGQVIMKKVGDEILFARKPHASA